MTCFLYRHTPRPGTRCTALPAGGIKLDLDGLFVLNISMALVDNIYWAPITRIYTRQIVFVANHLYLANKTHLLWWKEQSVANCTFASLFNLDADSVELSCEKHLDVHEASSEYVHRSSLSF